jgi:hypothetical protein
MSTLASKKLAQGANRRTVLRLSVNYPATLDTIRGEQRGSLVNISPKGAKLMTGTPPNAGTHGKLKIDNQEVYCRVAWNDNESCGLAFEHDLALDIVDAILASSQTEVMPVASAQLIPMGRKRAGQLTSASERERCEAAKTERTARINALAGLFSLSP